MVSSRVLVCVQALSLLFVLSFFSSLNLCFAEEQITFFTEDAGVASFIDKDGNLKGFAVEIVQEMIKRVGNKNTVALVPWARGYATVEKESNTALFSMIRNKERENLFKWVGPINKTRFVLFGRADSNFKIKTIDDAKKVKRVGCYRGDAREKILIEKGFKNLEAISGDTPNERNLKKLMMKRIDLWVTSRTDLTIAAKELGIRPDLFKEVVFVDEVHASIAFSKDTSDSVIKLWQKALDDLKQDGTYAKIMKKYQLDESLWAL